MAAELHEQVGSEAPIEQLSPALRLLCTLERFHLHNAELFFADSDFDPRYFPNRCGAFSLPCFWVDRDCLFVYGRQTPELGELRMFDGAGRAQQVLLPIHPLYLERFSAFLTWSGARDAAQDGLELWAVPTASTRTLLVWPDQKPGRALFVKTSLHHKIQGDRQITQTGLARSIGISQLLQHSRDHLPDRLGFFPESVGFIPRRLPGCGVIIRSIPAEIKEGRCLVAPLFSLLGGSGRYRPLLLTLLEITGMSLPMFLESALCTPFARLWLTLAFRSGLLLESHGQDLLLALTPTLHPAGRFYYRDCEGVAVDWELRRQLGLDEPKAMPCARSWRETYKAHGENHSLRLCWSLHGYLHYVLNEIDSSIRAWVARGWLAQSTAPCEPVTLTFSRSLQGLLRDQFGWQAIQQYNIYEAQYRFANTLRGVRRSMLGDHSAPLP